MIVFAHLLNDRSGSSRVLRSVMELIGDRGSNLLYVGGALGGLLDAPNGDVRRYWYRRGRFRAITLLAYLWSQCNLFVRLLRDNRIDREAVVYVNTLMPFGAALYGWVTGRPVLYHLHELSITPAPLRALLVGIARLTAARLIYVSDAHRALLPIAADRALTIHNALDPALLAVGRTSASRCDRLIVLMLSYNRPYKGVPEFLALADRLSGRTDIEFHLVLSDEFEAMVARSQPANLTIHPPSDRPEEFYRRAGVVLNLSRPDLCVETFGLTLLEAMAFGVPVIAPPVGGPAELVRDGQEGFLIDSRNSQALDAAINRLARDRATHDTMATAARARAEQFGSARFRSAVAAAVEAARNSSRARRKTAHP